MVEPTLAHHGEGRSGRRATTQLAPPTFTDTKAPRSDRQTPNGPGRGVGGGCRTGRRAAPRRAVPIGLPGAGRATGFRQPSAASRGVSRSSTARSSAASARAGPSVLGAGFPREPAQSAHRTVEEPPHRRQGGHPPALAFRHFPRLPGVPGALEGGAAEPEKERGTGVRGTDDEDTARHDHAAATQGRLEAVAVDPEAHPLELARELLEDHAGPRVGEEVAEDLAARPEVARRSALGGGFPRAGASPDRSAPHRPRSLP